MADPSQRAPLRPIRPLLSAAVVALVAGGASGAGATITVGSTPGPTVADGEKESTKLAAGRHVLRLVPSCVVRGEVVAVVIDVGPASTSTGSRAPSASATPPVGAGSSAVGGVGDGSDPDAALAGGPETAIYEMPSFPVDRPGDPRDARLLAIIAAICVFGVTGAIIRAILAPRAKRMIRIHTNN